MIVNITGVFYLPSGVVASSRMVAFKPIDRSVRAGYLGGLVPDPVIIQTGIDGSVDFNLLTGSYFVTIEAKDTDNIGRGLIFAGKANVPDAPSASISEILDAAVAPDEPPVWYTQAIQAAEDAIDAAERAETAAAEVEYPVSYAPQALTAPQQAQARSNIGAADSATAVVNTRTVTAGPGLTGGGDLTADRTIAADFATEAEALAGAATDKVMSPARVRQAAGAVTRGGFSLDLAGMGNGSLSNLGEDLYEIKLSVSNVASAASHLFFRVRVTGDTLLTAGYTVLEAGGTGLEVTGTTGEWLRIPINSTAAYRVTRHGRTQYWSVEVTVNGKVGYALVNTGAAATRVTGVNLSVAGGSSFTSGNLYGRAEDFS